MVPAGLALGILLEPLDVGRMCEVVDGDVDGESDRGDAEAGEHVAEHEPIREHRVLAPGLTLGPWVAVEGRHVGPLLKETGEAHAQQCQ